MKKAIALFLFCAFSAATNAQDTLVLSNNDVIVGSIKGMDQGVLSIETPYSDSDFQIEWYGIKKVKSSQRYLLTLSDGSRINGYFESNGDGKIKITDEEGRTRTVDPKEIVYFNDLDDGFLSRVNANIDFGYTLTKANNQSQLSLNSRLGYNSDYWSLSGYYNSLLSRQDSVPNVQRNDAGINFKYFLPRDWYLSADVTFLSNTEQAIDLRSNTRIGAGKYLIHTNHAYWGAAIGAASNIERFSEASGAENRESWEGFIGTELDLFDIGDLNLYSSAIAYPSFTESGRVRADFNFDAKYDNFFLDDFYIRAGFTVNYDNQPAVAGSETDYIFTTGFGWEW